ncbi:MAG: hypothetical protein IPH35_26895 [Rhodoferax sp.]|nr:hypothetical protein [Rhodoferax sp.]
MDEMASMPQERGAMWLHLNHVFDPFFTTKLGKGGSGLGLHIVYNLVQELLGGNIQVDNTPDSGACFTLLLPLDAPS